MTPPDPSRITGRVAVFSESAWRVVRPHILRLLGTQAGAPHLRLALEDDRGLQLAIQALQHSDSVVCVCHVSLSAVPRIARFLDALNRTELTADVEVIVAVETDELAEMFSATFALDRWPHGSISRLFVAIGNAGRQRSGVLTPAAAVFAAALLEKFPSPTAPYGGFDRFKYSLSHTCFVRAKHAKVDTLPAIAERILRRAILAGLVGPASHTDAAFQFHTRCCEIINSTLAIGMYAGHPGQPGYNALRSHLRGRSIPELLRLAAEGSSSPGEVVTFLQDQAEKMRQTSWALASELAEAAGAFDRVTRDLSSRIDSWEDDPGVTAIARTRVRELVRATKSPLIFCLPSQYESVDLAGRSLYRTCLAGVQDALIEAIKRALMVQLRQEVEPNPMAPRTDLFLFGPEELLIDRFEEPWAIKDHIAALSISHSAQVSA